MTMFPFDSQLIAGLCDPFHPLLVEWKPQAVSKDGKRALAVPYIDARHYQHRLDQIAPGWQTEYEFIKPDGSLVKCRLTIAGVTREEVGESDPAENNTATSAVAQSFKRACTAFGLGRYLYLLPQAWCEYDSQSRRITSPPVLPAWAKPGGGGYPMTERKHGYNGHFAAVTATGVDEEDAATPPPQVVRENGAWMSVEEASQVIFTLRSRKYPNMKGRPLGEVLEEAPELMNWLVNTYSPTPETQHLKDAAVLLSTQSKEES